LEFDSETHSFYINDVDVSSDITVFTPDKNIFYNHSNREWYKDKEFSEYVDISKLQKKMNYHAHISFTKWEESTGKNVRFQKKDYQDIQTITAEVMHMERGKINSKSVRLNHWQLKYVYEKINKIIQNNQIVTNDLKEQIENKSFTIEDSSRELQGYQASREIQRAQIKGLNVLVENQALQIEAYEVKKSIAKNAQALSLEINAKMFKETTDDKERILALERERKALEKENKSLKTNNTLLREKDTQAVSILEKQLSVLKEKFQATSTTIQAYIQKLFKSEKEILKLKQELYDNSILHTEEIDEVKLEVLSLKENVLDLQQKNSALKKELASKEAREKQRREMFGDSSSSNNQVDTDEDEDISNPIKM